MDVVVLVSRLLLAAVFAVAGTAKLLDRDGTAITLEQFGLPRMLTAPGAVLLPLSELAAAVLLVPDATAVVGAIGALALLAVFVVAIGASLARGEQPDCNCFGQLHSERVGPATLVRNTVLMVLAVIVVLGGHREAAANALDGLGSMNTATALAAAALALAVLGLLIQAWVSVNLLRQHGRLMLRLDALEGVGPGAQHQPTHAPGLPVGAPAPAFDLPAVDGSRAVLADLVDDQRPLVLAFVDPNCGSCRMLAPELVGRQRDGDGEGAAIAIVITRTDPEAARAMASEYDVALAVIDEDGAVADQFEVPGTPSGVAVGPEGLVHSELAVGPDDVRHLLAALDEPEDDGFSLPIVTMDPGSNGLPGVGERIPDLALETLEGAPASLLSVARGAPRLLVFWSPTCGYCDGMLDDVRALEGRDDGTPLLLVATGEAEANRAQGLRSPILLDPGFDGMGEHFRVPGTPSALRLDAEGRVVSALAVGAPEVLALAGVPAGSRSAA